MVGMPFVQRSVIAWLTAVGIAMAIAFALDGPPGEWHGQPGMSAWGLPYVVAFFGLPLALIAGWTTRQVRRRVAIIVGVFLIPLSVMCLVAFARPLSDLMTRFSLW